MSIPTSTYRPFGRRSPRLSELDVAKLINRTVEWAVRNKRELGFAAVNVGCDGVQRTTMFDGSSCQVEGEVCIAERQDGISACIQAPTQGNGLTLASLVFSAPVCEPVTGWWIVDADGYMYRVPQSLITAAPYWPLDVSAGSPVTIARAQTWARLMCSAALVIALNEDGGGVWINEGEPPGIWTQVWACALGGIRSQWTVIPGVTIDTSTPGLVDIIVDGAGKAILTGVYYGTLALGALSAEDLDGDDVALVDGNEYVAAVYRDATGLQILRGVQAAVGSAVAPTIPDEALPIAEVTVPYDLTASTHTVTATTVGRYGLAYAPISGYALSPPDWRGVLLRDELAANAGSRVVTVTLPAGGTGIVTGAVRVAYGYAVGSKCDLNDTTTSDKPYPRTGLVGTWQADTVGRIAGDMALVYRRGLAVEYAEGHVCLDGAAITDASDYVSLDEIDQTLGPALDVHSGVVGLPSTEVALLAAGDLRTGDRYRIRAAPDTAPTILAEQQAKGAWGTDPNVWTDETNYDVAAWLDSATAFTVTGSGAAGFPGRAVSIVLWETDDPDDTYLTAPVSYPGTLGETSGGLTTLDFASPVAASTMSIRVLTVVGVHLYAAWGWTAEDADGVETALSPLTDEGVNGYSIGAPSTLYSVAVTIPGGPTGTVKRHLYRFAFDYGSTPTGLVGPWAYLTNAGGELGGAYDRHCRRVATHVSTMGEPGTDPITIYDEDTDLTTLGTRPPSPLIYVGPLVVDAPRPVHLLQPMNL